MADWLFRMLALAMTGLLIYYGLRKYHQRELARVEAAELELDDYVKIALQAITFAWQCPHCGTPLLTAEGLNAHQDGGSSACAQAVERAERAAELAELRAAGMTAEQVPREDAWPSLAEADTAAELES
jgi:hypothetical protein